MTTEIETKEVQEVGKRALNAFEEIDRRKQELEESRKGRGIAVQLPLPKNVELHQLYLLNFCNRKQNPRHEKAGLRCLGVFQNMEELMEHVEEHWSQADCALHVAFQGRELVICESVEKQQHHDYGAKKRDEILAWHAERRKKADEEFQKNVQEKKKGEVGQSLKVLRDKTIEEAGKTTTRNAAIRAVTKQKLESGQLKRVRPVPRDAELRSQLVLVIDIFLDNNPKAWTGEVASEPVITCWGVFENDEDAKAFIRYYGVSVNMRNRQLFAIPMYEWNYPETYLDFEIPELFHDKAQERMMQNHLKKESEEVAKFSQECAVRGKPVPEKNQEFDPQKPNFKAEMWDEKNKELNVVRGAASDAVPDRLAFPAVPVEADFQRLPHGNPEIQMLADAAEAKDMLNSSAPPRQKPRSNRR